MDNSQPFTYGKNVSYSQFIAAISKETVNFTKSLPLTQAQPKRFTPRQIATDSATETGILQVLKPLQCAFL